MRPHKDETQACLGFMPNLTVRVEMGLIWALWDGGVVQDCTGLL